ncbi:hypothetical protein FisN_5Lh072 [Fistulifera solaris]|uniref:Ataxin-10 domain-containing protein n=1 Tax=Fistulifera solaris TaxID=1519565 RepID=A0A1Z5JJR2_FISSO|nr:hypothetical protein FisN_5Lh072 [Fistulifera solaris]|eukprot:GAX14011.1 hypothetical protein FisN_5Lh072 [Fistulifera solaris]
MIVMTPETIDRTSSATESNEDENSMLEDALESVKSMTAGFSSDNSFVGTLISRMNPALCLTPHSDTTSSCVIVDDSWFEPTPISVTIKTLLGPLRSEGRGRTVALQRIYRLTDREHEANRVAAVCTTKYDLIGAILPSLAPTGSSIDRRQALLLINNLCIPMENKAAILLGDQGHSLVSAFLETIRARVSECYLAVVCLFNLSLLPEAKPILFRYVPSQRKPETHSETYLKKTMSLLRTIESLTRDCLPFVINLDHASDVLSVEREAVRWSLCLMRHLSALKENAVVVANETMFPSAAIQCLEVSLQTNSDLGFWRQDSLETSSLMILVHLAQHGAKCVERLRSYTNVQPVLRQLKGKGGIHELRAITVLRILEETPIETDSGKTSRKLRNWV